LKPILENMVKRGLVEKRVSFELEEPPQGAVAIKAYGNTNFVNIMLERKFYKQLLNEVAYRKKEDVVEALVRLL
jgi:hypothetical protein